MNTTNLTEPVFRLRSLLKLAVKLGICAGLAAAPVHAQDKENIPAGYNEDEWYDPGDWFDGNNVEPAGTDWWESDWQDSYAHAHQYPAVPYSYYYYWDPIVIRWATRDDAANASKQGQAADRGTADNRSDRSGKAVVFDGKVDGFKKVSLQNSAGEEDQSTFVRIRLKDGEARVVDLGSDVNLSTLNLEKGDQIRVTGRNQRVDGREVLAANQVAVDGRTFPIRQDGDRTVSVQGTVKQFTQTSIDGAKEKNLLVRLELENGKSCVVDLGKGTNLSDLDLEQGAEIRLEGKKTEVNGKSLIVARKISVDDETTRLRGHDKSERHDQGASRDRDGSGTDATSRTGNRSDDAAESASND